MFDLAIVGGGLIGQALALALQDRGLSIVLLESGKLQGSSKQGLDRRSIALTPKTADILKNLGVWPDLVAYCTPIHHIHVSNQGYFGFTRIHAEEEELESLGYIVLLDDLAAALSAHLSDSLKVWTSSSIEQISYTEDHAILNLSVAGEKQQIATRLVVGADGAQSWVRSSLNIALKNLEYEQVAIVGNLKLSEPHNYWAYERFTPTGPFALLPGPANTAAFVWTVTANQVPELLKLDPQAFLQAAQAVFGYRRGRFLEVGERNAYPLRLVVAHTLFSKRAILIGNAAQSLHPVAGQGFNLGLRDVAECADFILKRGVQDLSWLKDYEQLRLPDRDQIIQTTHALVKGFSHSLGMVHGLSSLLMAILERCPYLKSKWNRRFMGRVRGSRSPLLTTPMV